MTRAQIQQIVVILLLLVFGFVWMNTRKGPVTGPAAPTAAPPHGPAARAAPSQPRPPGLKEEPAGKIAPARDMFQLPDRLLRKVRGKGKTLEAPLGAPPKPDPSIEAPVSAPPLNLSTLDLQGVFWGAGRPQAIINRKILSVGDTIEGAKISAISKEGVTLDYSGQTVELKRKADIRSGDGTGPARDL